MMLKYILILVLTVFFFGCDSQNKRSSQSDLGLYVRKQIEESEKWMIGERGGPGWGVMLWRVNDRSIRHSHAGI